MSCSVSPSTTYSASSLSENYIDLDVKLQLTQHSKINGIGDKIKHHGDLYRTLIGILIAISKVMTRPSPLIMLKQAGRLNQRLVTTFSHRNQA